MSPGKVSRARRQGARQKERQNEQTERTGHENGVSVCLRILS